MRVTESGAQGSLPTWAQASLHPHNYPYTTGSMKMFCISTARPLTLILAVAALSATALAQSGGLDDLVDGLAAESKEALAASEARVKKWFADDDVQALKEGADAGQAAEIGKAGGREGG